MASSWFTKWGWATMVASATLLPILQSFVGAQERGERGNRGGGRASGGAQASGGARASGQGAVRAPSAGAGAEVRGQAGGSVRTQVDRGASTPRVTTPSTNPSASGAAAGSVRSGQRVEGAADAAGRATVPARGAAEASARLDANAGAGRRAVDARLEAGARADREGRGAVDARLDADARTGRRTGDARIDADARAGRDAVDARLDADARANAADRGRATTRPDSDAAADARTDAAARVDGRARNTASWNRRDAARADRDQLQADLSAAMRAQARDRDGDRNRDGDRDRDGARDRDGDFDWRRSNPQRSAYWGGWGSNVRNGFFISTPFFTGGWWDGNRNLIGIGYGRGYGYGGGWWGYQPWASRYPWNYWWGTPRWGQFAGWYGWNYPYYYDYGPGGNVVYYNNRVLVNDQVVGTPTEYAQSAADLATVDPATLSTSPDDWQPLGTFSFAISENESNPPRVIQLAVNKDGIISGSVLNRSSGKAYTVQGRVDKETQRVAFTIGDNHDVVLETGLYNLTQPETPVLAHFGGNKTATYLFARLDPPEAEGQETPRTATAPPAPAPAP